MCTQKMLQSSWLHCCREVRDGCRVLLAVWLTGERDGNATTQLRLNPIKSQIHHDLSYTLQKQMVRNDYCCGFRGTDELTDTHIEMMSLITMQLLTNFMHICLHMEAFAALWLLQTSPSYCIKLQREDTGHSKTALHLSGFESPTKSCAPPDPGHVRG